MKALITIELDYPEQIYDLYETKEIRFYDKDGVYMLWEGGFEIKPMPKKKVFAEGLNDFQKGTKRGWNDCIDTITGETE